ncbi:dihydroneopterin aldolase [Catalinimonas alkaloidigena]|uniref:dihydroneopterin aldolase n=1 Tax=Catalinimonas alkaloidigena TaxID=1075417 RepID=UPI002406D757|nr:dihydroneopterin aldolase [Catalinimonas alkaloidigena]MDF9800658.1 dihydroneopterin aldolase [Catalinimonas alkaloidigena]
MGKISLQGLEFFAYHGFHDEEQKIGNRYEVDITVETNFDQAAEDDLLEHTVDYGQLYYLVQEEMQKTTRLLERLTARIAERTLQKWTVINSVEVSVSKLNPPLGGLCKKAKVTLQKSRNA